MAATPRFRLYDMHYCPFCRDVRHAAKELGVKLEIVDVLEDREARASLIARRGRGTVPVLGIFDGEREELMGESRDIIAYLEQQAQA